MRETTRRAMRAMMMTAPLALAAACSVPGLSSRGDTAEVSVVNAEPSPGSVIERSDDGSPAAGSGQEAESADSIDSASPTGPRLDEIAGPAGITLGSSDDRMSTNPGSLTVGWGHLTVDGASTTGAIDGQGAAPGEKFLLVDYQVLGADGSGNFFDEAFRVVVDGEVYPNLLTLNEIIQAGVVVNSQAMFQIPETATSVRFEGGAPEGERDGFRAWYDIEMTPVDPAAPVPDVPAVPEATATDISLTTPEATMSTNPGNPETGLGMLAVDTARTTSSHDTASPTPGSKFVVVDYQLAGLTIGNFFDHAFRLQAEGEWYPPLTLINETVGAGKVFNGEVVFEVPVTATTVVFEGGMPERFASGSSARFEIVFPPIDGSGATGGAQTAEDAAPAGAADPEAKAWDITLLTDDDVMSTNPQNPTVGSARLTVDDARTTVKIEETGAAAGSKFVVVDYQLSDQTLGNIFEEAFRLQADGEWYPPRVDINEIGRPGSVLNGQLVFEIPAAASSVILEGGVPLGATDGLTARYEIQF